MAKQKAVAAKRRPGVPVDVVIAEARQRIDDGEGWSAVSRDLGVSPPLLRFWLTARTTMPLESLKQRYGRVSEALLPLSELVGAMTNALEEFQEANTQVRDIVTEFRNTLQGIREDEAHNDDA